MLNCMHSPNRFWMPNLVQKLQWDSLQHTEHEAQSKCYIASGMTWLSFPPQLIFNQLPVSPEDPKPNFGRSSAEPTHTVIPSYQVQSVCGMHFLLMSASCHKTASRLICTPWHWCRRLSAVFLSTALHCFYLLCLFCCLVSLLLRRAYGTITVVWYCLTSELAPSWKKKKLAWVHMSCMPTECDGAFFGQNKTKYMKYPTCCTISLITCIDDSQLFSWRIYIWSLLHMDYSQNLHWFDNVNLQAVCTTGCLNWRI